MLTATQRGSRVTGAHLRQVLAQTLCIAAAPGSSLQRTSAPRPGAGSQFSIGTTLSASVLPGRYKVLTSELLSPA
jgi:hypothetical protein